MTQLQATYHDKGPEYLRWQVTKTNYRDGVYPLYEEIEFKPSDTHKIIGHACAEAYNIRHNKDAVKAQNRVPVQCLIGWGSSKSAAINMAKKATWHNLAP